METMGESTYFYLFVCLWKRVYSSDTVNYVIHLLAVVHFIAYRSVSANDNK